MPEKITLQDVIEVAKMHPTLTNPRPEYFYPDGSPCCIVGQALFNKGWRLRDFPLSDTSVCVWNRQRILKCDVIAAKINPHDAPKIADVQDILDGYEDEIPTWQEAIATLELDKGEKVV